MKQKIVVDFPLDLQKEVVRDENPKTYHLSILAILEKNGVSLEAKKRQEQLLEGIDSVQSVPGSGIYKYPKDTIHFTVIHFVGLSSTLQNEKDFKKTRNEHINKIRSIIKDLNKEVEDKIVEFAYIFTRKTESLAIQAFPSEDLLMFFKKLQTALEDSSILKPVKVKDNDKKRFGTNVVRFFRDLSPEEFKNIAKNVRKLNYESDNCGREEKKLFFKMNLTKLSFFTSDNWLTNIKSGKLDTFELL